MALTKFFVYFQPKEWVFGEAVPSGPEEKIDATSMLLRMRGKRVAEALEVGLEKQSKLRANLERMILAECPSAREHVVQRGSPFAVRLDEDNLREFFRSNGIVNLMFLTGNDMRKIREVYEVPHSVKMPNGKFVWPREGDKDGRSIINAHMRISAEDLVCMSKEDVFEAISHAMTGTSWLKDVRCTTLCADESSILLRVSGDISEIVARMSAAEEGPTPRDAGSKIAAA